MAYRFLWVAAASLTLGSPAWAAKCGTFNEARLKAIAEELVAADLAGARLPSGSACLSELKPKYTRVMPDPVQELAIQPEFLEAPVTVRVTGVKKAGEGKATAEYEVRAGSGAGAAKTYQDRITFMLNRNAKVAETDGCGVLLQFPAKWLVRKACLPSDPPQGPALQKRR